MRNGLLFGKRREADNVLPFEIKVIFANESEVVLADSLVFVRGSAHNQ